MKVLGLLGGMSWESTVEYYRLAKRRDPRPLGGLHSAPLLLWSADFAEIEELQASGSWEEAGSRLAGAARALERAGAELLVLCTNTMHKVAGVIEAAVDIPLGTSSTVWRRRCRPPGCDESACSGPASAWRSRSGPNGWPGMASMS